MLNKSSLTILMGISLFIFGCSISGKITPEDPEAHVEGIAVTLKGDAGNVTIATDNQGKYLFDSVESGNYIVTPSKWNYDFTPDSIRVAVPGGNLDRVNFQADSNFKIILPLDGELEDEYGQSVSISGDYALVGAHKKDANGTDSGAAYLYRYEEHIWIQAAQLTADDGAAGDRFGYSVSIGGDHAIVGAPYDDDSGQNTGAAYIFYRHQDGAENWGQQTKLSAADGAVEDNFGWAVSISGDYAVVGTPEDDMGTGSAYVFYRNQGGPDNWGQQAKLIASSHAAGDLFGYSISISGDHAIVGAFGAGSSTGSAYVFHRLGSTWTQKAKLTASDGVVGDWFGFSVSISGDYAIVGASGDDGGEADSGSAYIYKKDGGLWTVETKLTASDASANARFGASVSIWGAYAAVGAPYHENGTGSAYIFYKNENDPDVWGVKEKFVLTDGESGDHFGYVCITGGSLYMIVGAPDNTDSGGGMGSAHIYKRNWNEKPKLTASDGVAIDKFGYSVSISGNYAIVGANGDDFGTGSAYIFKHDGNTWTEEDKITASDGASGDNFGNSVSISGDYAVVGALYDDDSGNDSGSAYIFKRTGSNWIEEAKLTASDGSANSRFGCSVSISGDYVIVGAYGDDTGSAYIFQKPPAGWSNMTETIKLTASDGMTGEGFGYSVSISGSYAIVGATGDDDCGDKSGSIYVFERSGSAWTEKIKMTASDCSALDNFGHSVSMSGDDAIVGAYGDESGTGAAYIFKRDGSSWAEDVKLTPSDGDPEDWFGWSVFISDDYAIVGAYQDDEKGDDDGSAYIFKRGSVDWIEQYKLTAGDGASGDFFGYSVALSSEHAIVGARNDDDAGNASGAAYIFGE